MEGGGERERDKRKGIGNVRELGVSKLGHRLPDDLCELEGQGEVFTGKYTRQHRSANNDLSAYGLYGLTTTATMPRLCV